jgi:regulator of PEP synthase PpsR (kinase-PPPase family)
MKKIIVHLISDSSGQTVKYAANNAFAKFDNLEIKKYYWPMIRSMSMLDELLGNIQRKPGLVLYTVSDIDLRNKLKEFCFKQKLPCVSVVGKIIKEMVRYVGIDPDDNSNYIRKLDDNYFDKVEAIDFSLRHDDGQSIETIHESDIILIGPSRTSKTPTSIFLAYNGFKTANIPFVFGHNMPEEIFFSKRSLIYGLIISPERLIEIRNNRMDLLQIRQPSSYTDIRIVRDECLMIKKICLENGWPVLDVSSRSIEETAAIIMKFYYEKKK